MLLETSPAKYEDHIRISHLYFLFFLLKTFETINIIVDINSKNLGSISMVYVQTGNLFVYM